MELGEHLQDCRKALLGKRSYDRAALSEHDPCKVQWI